MEQPQKQQQQRLQKHRPLLEVCAHIVPPSPASHDSLRHFLFRCKAVGHTAAQCKSMVCWSVHLCLYHVSSVVLTRCAKTGQDCCTGSPAGGAEDSRRVRRRGYHAKDLSLIYQYAATTCHCDLHRYKGGTPGCWATLRKACRDAAEHG